MSKRGYSIIGLYQPEKKVNFGCVMRIAGCYEVASVMIQGRKFQTTCADTQQAHRHIPVIETESILNNLPVGCTPVAVEFIKDSFSLPKFTHPPRAMYIFGPESGSLPKEILEKCEHTVYIPTKFCLNLGMTCGTVLYDRVAKSVK